MSAELNLTPTQKEILIILLIAGVVLLAISFCSYYVWKRCCDNAAAPDMLTSVGITPNNRSDDPDPHLHNSSLHPSAPRVEDLEELENNDINIDTDVNQNQFEATVLLHQDPLQLSDLPSYEDAIRQESR